jgi:hypothetical protein
MSDRVVYLVARPLTVSPSGDTLHLIDTRSKIDNHRPPIEGQLALGPPLFVAVAVLSVDVLHRHTDIQDI